MKNYEENKTEYIKKILDKHLNGNFDTDEDYVYNTIASIYELIDRNLIDGYKFKKIGNSIKIKKNQGGLKAKIIFSLN